MRGRGGGRDTGGRAGSWNWGLAGPRPAGGGPSGANQPVRAADAVETGPLPRAALEAEDVGGPEKWGGRGRGPGRTALCGGPGRGRVGSGDVGRTGGLWEDGDVGRPAGGQERPGKGDEGVGSGRTAMGGGWTCGEVGGLRQAGGRGEAGGSGKRGGLGDMRRPGGVRERWGGWWIRGSQRDGGARGRSAQGGRGLGEASRLPQKQKGGERKEEEEGNPWGPGGG